MFLPSKVYVILPQTFIKTAIAESEIAINGRQVTKRDVDNLYAKCISPDSSFSAIGHTPISFKSLNNPVMFNPIGEECTKLYGTISVVLLDKRIKEFFDTSAKSLKKNFVYAGESNVAIEKADKDINLPGAVRLLINFREEHISINLCKGKAILTTKYVDWGANHAIYALQDLLKIDFSKAKSLINKLNLNTNCVDTDFYVLNDGQNLAEYNMKAINKRVIDTLDYLAENIKKEIDSFKLENRVPVYITGNRFCEIRGVKEILNNALGGEMLEVLIPKNINYDNSNDYPLVSYLEKIYNDTTISFNFLQKSKGRVKH
jgi:cell division ATPase FtsA